MKEHILYEDECGNKIIKKYVKSRGIWQIYGKNRSGKILAPEGYNEILKKSGITSQLKSTLKKAGIEVKYVKGDEKC